MIFRLLLILSFLRLLMNAKQNIDYYQIIFYLILYISLREYLLYLQNGKKLQKKKKLLKVLIMTHS